MCIEILFIRNVILKKIYNNCMFRNDIRENFILIVRFLSFGYYYNKILELK